MPSLNVARKKADPSLEWDIVKYSTSGAITSTSTATIDILAGGERILSMANSGNIQYMATSSIRELYYKPRVRDADWEVVSRALTRGSSNINAAGVAATTGLLLARYPSEAGADNVGQLQVYRVANDSNNRNEPEITFRFVQSHFGPDGRVPDDYIDIACTKSGGCLAATSAGRLEYWAPKPNKYERNSAADRNLDLEAGEFVFSIDLANYLVRGTQPTDIHTGYALISKPDGTYRIAKFNYTPPE